MEKRVLLAFFISLALLGAYWYFFPPPKYKEAPVKASEAISSSTNQPIESAVSGDESQTLAQQLVADTPEIDQLELAETIKVSTSLYDIEFNTDGATLSSMRLKGYSYELDPPVILYKRAWNWIMDKKNSANKYDGTRLVDMIDQSVDGRDKVLNFMISKNDKNLIYTASEWRSDGEKKYIKFRANINDSVSIVKTYLFDDQNYKFSLNVEIFNEGSTPVLIAPTLMFGSGSKIIESSYNAQHKVAMSLIDDDYEKYDIDEPLRLQNFLWVAISDVYFVSGIKGLDDKWSADFVPVDDYINGKQQSNPLLTLNREPLRVGGNNSWDQSYEIFMGPKDVDLLEDFDETFGETLDLLFNIIARPMIYALRWFHEYVGNWGIAIMMLTLSVRLILFPLAFKGMQSMKNMSRLNPRMKLLRKKLANDKQKLNNEIMQLYRKNKVNPVSGCLPMIVQIPIFIALYWSLLPAVELRHEPFIWWLNDLSHYDPYMILPLLMGISMYVQQKIAPQPANLDPMQQRIMKFLPVMMTLFFVNFPSGLVLYWVTSNLITIGQQFIFNRIKVKEVVE
ncbi:MAG: membrane protein insertase YidC [SAR324 cluster bacterium]|nr:membrane protein insertase YidC [SAR324 cluster bacterium]